MMMGLEVVVLVVVLGVIGLLTRVPADRKCH